MATDIKDKIAKLLALADSPNEHEAKAALLKARELMAEHKILPEEVQKAKKSKVIVQTIGVVCTKMTDVWAPSLSATIAKHYCCKAYRNHARNAKKIEIGFAGLEDDFDICKRIFLYAYDCVKVRCKEIDKDHRGRGWTGAEIREMCNAYGWGFHRGLKEAFDKQTEQHQEWGLVMVVPQPVHDATSSHGKPTVYGAANTGGWRKQYAAAGYKDGQNFDPGKRLEGGGATSEEVRRKDVTTSVSFFEKEAWVDGDPIIGRTYAPVFMIAHGKEYFVINRVVKSLERGYGKYDVEHSDDEVERIKSELMQNGGKYFKSNGFYDNPIEMIAEIEMRGHTFVEPEDLFVDCQESKGYGTGFVDFHGNRNEVSAAFSYRIYDTKMLDAIRAAIAPIVERSKKGVAG